MRLGVLFSGGKDSTLALHYAAEKEQVVCLITLLSQNKESYMFHTPNIDITALQAEALGLPQVAKITRGRKRKGTRRFGRCNRRGSEKVPNSKAL